MSPQPHHSSHMTLAQVVTQSSTAGGGTGGGLANQQRQVITFYII